jgi:hypothetical protein
MNRAAFLWFCLAIFCASMLYITSQRMTDGLQHLSFIRATLQQEEESQRVLQAEWSYLNHPDSLEKRSREHLNLAPFNPRQFITLDKIGQLKAVAPEAGQPEKPVTAAKSKIATQNQKPAKPVAAAVKPAAIRPQNAQPPSGAGPADTDTRGFNDVLKSLKGAP